VLDSHKVDYAKFKKVHQLEGLTRVALRWSRTLRSVLQFSLSPIVSHGASGQYFAEKPNKMNEPERF
jgi:hypothetical protein